MTVTYNGVTAGTTAANPPSVLIGVVGGVIQWPGASLGSTGAIVYPSGGGPRGGKLWLYNSTNAPSDMSGAGSITDGAILGMRRGDVMICVFNGGTATTDSYVFMGVLNSTESSLSTGAFNLASNFTT